jgi:integrase/recombinase XerD
VSVLLRGIAGSVHRGHRYPEQLSIPVNQDLFGRCGWGVLVGSFDELAGLEAGAGADECDEVRRVHRTPTVLR